MTPTERIQLEIEKGNIYLAKCKKYRPSILLFIFAPQLFKRRRRIEQHYLTLAENATRNARIMFIVGRWIQLQKPANTLFPIGGLNHKEDGEYIVNRNN